DVEVSVDGFDWYFVGTGCRDFTVDISNAEVELDYIVYVRISNNDDLTNTPDGYDLDGVNVLSGNCDETEDDETIAPYHYMTVGEDNINLDGYPNPTSGETVVSFSVPVNALTTVDVYNMEGKKVATLFSETAS